MNLFADRLKIARKKNKISQDELSNMLDISRTQISKYERGIDVPNGTILFKMTKLLKVSAEYLLGIINHVDLDGYYQFTSNKRNKLFKIPEGELQYDYFFNGEEKTSIFSYMFGIFSISEHKIAGLDSNIPAPIIPAEFQPILYLEETKGDFLSTMLNANNDFMFGALDGFLNETFALGSGYLDSASRRSQVQLIMPRCIDSLPAGATPMGSKKYVIISAYRGYKVRNYAVDLILEAFLDFYLPLPIAQKIMFLERV